MDLLIVLNFHRSQSLLRDSRIHGNDINLPVRLIANALFLLFFVIYFLPFKGDFNGPRGCYVS